MSNTNKKITEFLNKFENCKDDKKSLLLLCEDFYSSDAEELQIPKDYKILLVDDDNIGRVASVNFNKELKLNYTRQQVLYNYKIKSDDPDFLEKLKTFTTYYESNSSHTREEDIIYKQIKKPAWQPYLAYLGNYEYLNIEWIQAILHENQHIKQHQIFDELKTKTKFKDEDYPYLFMMVFENMYINLDKNNKLEYYQRKNEFFPIEIDAEYRALSILKNYYKDNKNPIFLKYFNFQDTTNGIEKDYFINKIVSDFEYLHSLLSKNGLKTDIHYNECINNIDIIKQYLSDTYDMSKLYTTNEKQPIVENN